MHVYRDDCCNCAAAPFDCTICSRMNEPFEYDENGDPVYKDLFTSKPEEEVIEGEVPER